MEHKPSTQRIWGVESPKPETKPTVVKSVATARPAPVPGALARADGASITSVARPDATPIQQRPAPAPVVAPAAPPNRETPKPSAPPTVAASGPKPGPRFSEQDLARLVADGPAEPAHGVTLPAPQCSIAAHPDPERVMALTRAANQQSGLGATMIPGTRIELLNFSPCPRCGKVLSQLELYDHYGNPPADLRLERKLQMRRDVRAGCKGCGAFFFPTLLVIEGPTIREVQYMSRVQVVDAIELFMRESLGREVLTRNRETLMLNGRLASIRVDISLKDLAARPALVSNFLQHTPRQLAKSLLDGMNIGRNDPLFGAWFPARQEKGSRILEELLAAA